MKEIGYKLLGWGCCFTIILLPFGVIILELSDIIGELRK